VQPISLPLDGSDVSELFGPQPKGAGWHAV